MESQFKNNDLQLGKKAEYTSLTIVFEGKSDMKEIAQIVPSCGCTKTEYKDGNVVVHYNIGMIPYHLGNTQNIRKTIIVHYTDGTSEELAFNLTVTKEL